MEDMSNTGKEQDNDELSFKEFKSQFAQLQKFVVSVSKYVLRSLTRYYLLFILLCAGFLGLGYYQYISQTTFTATSTYVYTELSKKSYGEMIDKLEDMILSGSYRQVAEALKITEKEAMTITYISAKNGFGSKLSEDITNKEKYFYITVVTTDNKMFERLQPAIENYFNSNLLVVKMVNLKFWKMKERLVYLKGEQIMLDSLKLAYTQSLEKASSSISPNSNPFNPVELYEKSGKINQEIVEMNALMQDKRAVITADKFMAREHARENSLASFMVKYFLLFVATSLLLIFLFSMFKKQESTV
jgi:hypothetical protein